MENGEKCWQAVSRALEAKRASTLEIRAWGKLFPNIWKFEH